MLDYAGLEALAAVVREGSFERAVRALHITPSAVSQRIRALEERAGCTLVVREQPCRATEVGRQLCQHVDRVRLLEHELQHALPVALAGQPDEDGARVPLPVAVNADSLATWFAPAVAAFAAQAPVLLELVVDDQDHTAQWLRTGTVLAAVTGSKLAPAGFNSRSLGAMRYVAAASPAFVARHFPRGVGLAELARAPSLQFNAKDALQARWVRQSLGEDVALLRHTVPSSQAFVAAGLAGMGWGMQPLALVAPHLAAGDLVELLPATPLDVPLYWQQARAGSTLLEGLTRFVTGEAERALLPPAMGESAGEN